MSRESRFSDDELMALILDDYAERDLPAINVLSKKYSVGNQLISRIIPKIEAERLKKRLTSAEGKLVSAKMTTSLNTETTCATDIQKLFCTVQDVLVQAMNVIMYEAKRQLACDNHDEYTVLLEKIRLLASATVLLQDRNASELNEYDIIAGLLKEESEQISSVIDQIFTDRKQFYELIRNARRYKAQAEKVQFLEQIISDNRETISELEQRNEHLRSALSEDLSLKCRIGQKENEIAEIRKQYTEEISIIRQAHRIELDELKKKLDMTERRIKDLTKVNTELTAALSIFRK